MVQSQMVHMSSMKIMVAELKEADREREDELQQLRATVAAHEQQLGISTVSAGARTLQGRSGPPFLAEQSSCQSVEGGDVARALMPTVRHGCAGETGERVVAQSRALDKHYGRNLGEAFEATTHTTHSARILH